jgi:hypothetical protein
VRKQLRVSNAFSSTATTCDGAFSTRPNAAATDRAKNAVGGWDGYRLDPMHEIETSHPTVDILYF